MLFKWSTFYFIIHNQSETPVNSHQKIKRYKKNVFSTIYIHGFYDDIINPPFENKDIQKNWLISNLRQKLAEKSLMFYKGICTF